MKSRCKRRESGVQKDVWSYTTRLRRRWRGLVSLPDLDWRSEMGTTCKMRQTRTANPTLSNDKHRRHNESSGWRTLWLSLSLSLSLSLTQQQEREQRCEQNIVVEKKKFRLAVKSLFVGRRRRRHRHSAIQQIQLRVLKPYSYSLFHFFVVFPFCVIVTAQTIESHSADPTPCASPPSSQTKMWTRGFHLFLRLSYQSKSFLPGKEISE